MGLRAALLLVLGLSHVSTERLCMEGERVGPCGVCGDCSLKSVKGKEKHMGGPHDPLLLDLDSSIGAHSLMRSKCLYPRASGAVSRGPPAP